MNQDKVLELIESVLGDFWFHPDLVQDLVSCIAKTGCELKFFSLFMARLKYLRDQGVNAVRHEEFEILTKATGIFSMHLTGKGFNIRILYSFSPDKIPVLLIGFFKRDGKKKTDYTQYIPLAQQRLSEELEAHEYE